MTFLNEFIASLSSVLYLSKLKIARHKYCTKAYHIQNENIFYNVLKRQQQQQKMITKNIKHTHSTTHKTSATCHLFGCGDGVNNHRKVVFSNTSFDESGGVSRQTQWTRIALKASTCANQVHAINVQNKTQKTTKSPTLRSIAILHKRPHPPFFAIQCLRSRHYQKAIVSQKSASNKNLQNYK